MPSKSKQITLSGKGKYIRMQSLDKYGKWSLLLYLDKESLNTWAELKEQGIMNSLKMDADGQYVRLSRPAKKEFHGVETQLSPPIVLDKNGVATQDWIGNGSDITANLTFYTFTKKFGNGPGAAIRLEGIKVDNLVPYMPSHSGDEDEKKQVGNLDKLPPPTWQSNKWP